MPVVKQRINAAELLPSIQKIRQDLHIPEVFDTAVLDEVRKRITDGPLTEHLIGAPDRADATDIELWSIDPQGSRDLDQALHLERRGGGYRFTYAIADLGAWVTPGGPLDTAVQARGVTVYCPDTSVPLHPVELSHGAASLLADQRVPAILWRIDLDQRGATDDISVGRAWVRNRRALSYDWVQDQLDTGSADEQFRLLEEIGNLRLELEAQRGAVSLNLPEQSVIERDGHYELVYENSNLVESYNAQMSLCTGMAAAELMMRNGRGILRTLPPPEPLVLDRLRQQGAALGLPWPQQQPYRDWLISLPADSPKTQALRVAAARTLRGAGYVSFRGEVPAEHQHWAIGAPYAHVTAPLRRLVDRYANEAVLAAATKTALPSWAEAGLDEMPARMSAAARISNSVESDVVDLVEAAVVQHRVGETFTATVVSARNNEATCQLHDPAIIASVHTRAPIGTHITVRLDSASLNPVSVNFSVSSDHSS